jgi:hypothetical protein
VRDDTKDDGERLVGENQKKQRSVSFNEGVYVQNAVQCSAVFLLSHISLPLSLSHTHYPLQTKATPLHLATCVSTSTTAGPTGRGRMTASATRAISACMTRTWTSKTHSATRLCPVRWCYRVSMCV